MRQASALRCAFRGCASLASEAPGRSHYKPGSTKTTLVLNADYTPLSVTSAIRSVRLIDNNKAFALEHSEQILRSEMLRLACPTVIVLSQYAQTLPSKLARKKIHAELCSRSQILNRDAHSCQYCGSPATTVDHIVPKCRGGISTWTNQVASCSSCNAKKGSRELALTSMKLRRTPREPSMQDKLRMGAAELARRKRRVPGWEKCVTACRTRGSRTRLTSPHLGVTCSQVPAARNDLNESTCWRLECATSASPCTILFAHNFVRALLSVEGRHAQRTGRHTGSASALPLADRLFILF